MWEKPEVFALGFKRTLGLQKATQVAHARMRDTQSDNWKGVPSGIVFNKKDKRGAESTVLDTKHLQHVHNWWTNVFYCLKKLSNNS